MRFALIDTQSQTPDTVGTILVVTDTLGEAATEMLRRYPIKPKHSYEPRATIWQVDAGVAPGAAVPMAGADWCEVPSVGQLERLHSLLHGARSKAAAAVILGWRRKSGAEATKDMVKRMARKGE